MCLVSRREVAKKDLLQLNFATHVLDADSQVAHRLEVLETCSKMNPHVLVLREDNVAAPDNEKNTGGRHVIEEARFGHSVAAAAFVAANPCEALVLAEAAANSVV